MPAVPKGSHYLAKQSFADQEQHEYTVRRSSRASPRISPSHDAGVAELVDAPDSKSGFFGSGGSIPPLGTISTHPFKSGGHDELLLKLRWQGKPQDP